MARPTKKTEDAAETLARFVKQGATFKDACYAAGIGYSTGRQWVKEAEAEDAPDDKRAFLALIQKAQAEGKIERIKRIEAAGKKGSWQADAWYLERMYPEEFGRQRLEVTGAEGGPVKVALDWGDGPGDGADSA